MRSGGRQQTIKQKLYARGYGLFCVKGAASWLSADEAVWLRFRSPDGRPRSGRKSRVRPRIALRSMRATLDEPLHENVGAGGAESGKFRRVADRRRYPGALAARVAESLVKSPRGRGDEP